MARKMPKPDPERRSCANMRERQRVSKLNGMFEVLIGRLPPSLFKNKLSRAQVLRYVKKYRCTAAEVLPRAAPVADPWFLPRAPLVPRVCTVLGRPLTSFLLPVCKTETGTSVESLSEEWSVRNRIRHNWNTWEYTEGEEMTEDEEYTEGEEMTVDEDYTEEE
ncbi:hypothetical protein GCK72_015326 [Caenorhabditis remanei]|uniref:BHLH domain-containing protein n=1 Tax=Caenorhabditis remanei TaxID=31234 RepID=A0A6A5GW77_CAERE|nr:hypothetical protein GCK72_015326 [Caenorhabditis remanei]KAF1758866.1 hypothetical protein GCK72_015326 [Caenorhabditis remanei]